MPKTSCTTVSAVKKTVFTISPFILEESFSHPRKQQNMMSYVYIYSSVSVWVLDCKYCLSSCLFCCVGVVLLLWLFDFYDMINNNLSPDRPRYRSRYINWTSVTKTVPSMAKILNHGGTHQHNNNWNKTPSRARHMSKKWTIQTVSHLFLQTNT